MHSDTAHRGRLLYIALGSLGLDVAPAEMPPELHALHAWLDTWQGIGLIEHGGWHARPAIYRSRATATAGASVLVTGKIHFCPAFDRRLFTRAAGGGCGAPARDSTS